MNKKDTKDPKNYFQSDDELSQEEQTTKVEALKTSKPYEENFDMYVKYFKEYIHKCEELESDLFHSGSKQVNHPLLQFTMMNYEKNIGVFDLLKLNNGTEQVFERTAILFSYLESEVNKIRELLELSLLENLVMYGQRAGHIELAEGEAQLQTARMLGVYKKVYDLVRKLMSYVEHTIVQIHCIFNKNEPRYKQLFKNMNLYMPIEIIGKALRLIYLIDCIVNTNDHILNHWNIYKKLVMMTKGEPDKFGATPKDAKRMERLTKRFDNTILSGKCFDTVISMSYDKYFETTKSQLGLFKNNKEMRQFLELYFQETSKKLSELIGQPGEREQRTHLLQLMCVYSFFRRIYPSDQLRDVWRVLWQAQRQIPIIEGYADICIYIGDFMTNVCPLSRPSKSRDPKDYEVFIKEYIVKIDQSMPGGINSLYTQSCIWFSRMESIVTSNYSISSDVEKIREKAPERVGEIILERLVNRMNLLGQGVQLIAQLRRLIYVCMVLHTNDGVGFNKGLLGPLILGLETMKAIQQLCRQKAEAFDTTLLTKLIARDIDRIIRPIYSRIERQEQGKKKSDKIQFLSAMRTIMRIVTGPISELKLSILRFSLYFINKGFLKDIEYLEIKRAIERLQLVNYRGIIMQKFADCSFLYRCKQILPSFFEFKRNNPNTCKRLQFLFNSFEDSSEMISKCAHLENSKEVYLDYKQYILEKFEDSYMLPLKREIEDFLRINIHFMLIEKIEGQNPFKNQSKDLLKLVHQEKLRIFDSIIDIKTQITKSFNQTFYNINVINMYDMETYQQIRTMGNYLFGLELQNVYLPSQTIDQNFFDILQVLRTIPTFVEKYKYNMFTQTFLELTGQTKQISSIGIKQLSDSIKTHGLGILSTTVNAFYKYLIKKVKAFNKFLFDDYIQSPLAAEKNWLRKVVDREDYPGYYPYERAEIFYDKIKKLGRLEDEKTFLDKFRIHITSVGNVLGFVRLLRSASLNYTSKNVEFLPKKLQLEDNIADIAAKTTLSQVSVEACQELDDIFKSMEDSFTDRTDYLSVLVKSFRKIASKENKHLKQFYLIVPALTINYVENTLIGKEQINKRTSTRAFISDDGFVLGLAYFLALLKQNDQFQSLHWKTAVATKFKLQIEQNKDFTERVDKSKKVNEDLNMQKQLSLRMLNMQKDEFELLDYTLTAAKILFKEQESQPAPAAEKPAQQQAQQSLPETA